jgi:hypothetical protein
VLELLQSRDTLQQRVVLVNLSTLSLERLMKPITLIRVLGSALKRCDIIFIFRRVILSEQDMSKLWTSVFSWRLYTRELKTLICSPCT